MPALDQERRRRDRGSEASGDRAAASVVNVAGFVLCSSDGSTASRSGSQRPSGICSASSWTSPDFERPFGASESRGRPGDDRDDRLEGNAGERRVPDGTAAERDAERADLRVGDLGPGREPGEELACPARRARRRARRCRPTRRGRARRTRATRSRPARGTASRSAPCPGACRRARGRASPPASRRARRRPAQLDASARGGQRPSDIVGVRRRQRAAETPLRTTSAAARSQRATASHATSPNLPAFRSASWTVRPIGVFDSGVGGLTVLHECLVTMPHEDFVYLGDHARLPYGPRPLAEVRGVRARDRRLSSRRRT